MKNNTKKNSFLIRIYNLQTLINIEELLDTNVYLSKNDLLNRALEIGIEEIYESVFLRKKESGKKHEIGILPGELEKMVKQNILTLDDIFVILNINEYLLSTLYNIELAKINNLPVTDDMVRSGQLSDLPERLQAVKNELIARLEKGGRK